MGTKTRKQSHNAKNKVAVVRPFEVRQHLSRQLYSAAVAALDRLVQAEPGAVHNSLAAEVFRSCSAAISRFAFTPDDTSSFLATVAGIADRVTMDDQSDSAGVRQAALTIRSLLSQGTVDASVDESLVAKLADHAVLKAELEQRLSPEMVAEIKQVREALRLIEAKEDEAAAQAVSTIGFRSIMAPWRLLIRGMSQFYAGQFDVAAETWRRLPVGRTPRGMAIAMLATVKQRLGEAPLPDARRLGSIMSGDRKSDEAIRNELHELFNEQDYESLAIRVGRWTRDGSVDVSWLNAMRDRVYAELLDLPDLNYVREVTRHLIAPPWDPKFQLPIAIAKMLTGDPTKGDMLQDVDKYLAALERNEDVSEIDRRAIRGAVQMQVAYLLANLLKMVSGKSVMDAEIEGQRLEVGTLFGKRFATLIRDCITLWPKWDAPFELLSNGFNNEFLPPAIVTEVHHVRLHERGDDLSVVKAAVEFFIRQNEIEQAEPLVKQLLSMAPRDNDVRAMHWGLCKLEFRRELAANRIESANAILDRMSLNVPATLPTGVVSIMRATVCCRAADTVGIERHLADAYTSGVTPLAATFLMEIHITKAGLPANLKKRFRDERARLMKSLNLVDAKIACQIAGPSIASPIEEYAGRIGHLKDLVTYVKRVLAKVKTKDWTVEIANGIGEFVIAANDALLRRQFIRASDYLSRWHIFTLVNAIERGPQFAHYLLHDIVDAAPDDPDGLSKPLRAYAQELYQRSLELSHLSRYEDDFDDEDDDDDCDDDGSWDDDTSLFGGTMMMPDAADIIRTMPPELLESFKSDPKAVERAMRKMLPQQIVDLVLPALRKMQR